MIACANWRDTDLSKFSRNWMERIRLLSTKRSGFFLSCSRMLTRDLAWLSTRIWRNSDNFRCGSDMFAKSELDGAFSNWNAGLDLSAILLPPADDGVDSLSGPPLRSGNPAGQQLLPIFRTFNSMQFGLDWLGHDDDCALTVSQYYPDWPMHGNTVAFWKLIIFEGAQTTDEKGIAYHWLRPKTRSLKAPALGLSMDGWTLDIHVETWKNLEIAQLSAFTLLIFALFQ